MSADGKRPPGADAARTEEEADALDRIAAMSDDELEAHLEGSGVDVAALDEQVDSIRDQIVASGIGMQGFTLPVISRGQAPLEHRHARTRLRVIAVFAAALLAIAAGVTLASLLR